MNDRQFRQYIALRVERTRREKEAQAQAETEVQKKPAASAKTAKKTRKRSA